MGSLGGKVPDKFAGRTQVDNTVAEVRPQRYSYPSCHFKMLLLQFSCRVWPDMVKQDSTVNWSSLPEAQDVLHVVKAGLPVPEPEGGPQGA